MSTAAAEPAPPLQTSTGSAPSHVLGSLLGAILVLVGFVAAGYAAAVIPDSTPYIEVARIAVYLLVVGAGIAGAGFLASRNSAPGVSGGIILIVSIVIAAAFTAAAFAANFKDGLFGPILVGATLAAAGFGIFRLMTSKQGYDWCQAVDEQGWATFHNHKRTQGLLVRRVTIAGILAVGFSGAFALYAAEPFNPKKASDATVSRSSTTTTEQPPVEQVRQDLSLPLNYPVPFVEGKVVPLIPVANLALPVLIAMATLWVAWRAVNVPVFGDFLIATEAEMNKVSWTSRKRLIQDTIVVLVCLALLTVFLFVIDVFWGWLLSLEFIGVLPKKADTATEAANQLGNLKW